MAWFDFSRTGMKLAWRNLKNSRMQSALITVAMAVSIAALGGVRGVADVARLALRGDFRAWLAADVSVDTREPITEEQVRALDGMKQTGIAWTVMTTALTMAASDQAADPGFIAVKVIDPAVYPFYGRVVLSTGKTLEEALVPGAVAVSDDVQERLKVRVGDTIRIAGQPFRIAAVIDAEPDRFTAELGLGMRCILSREAYRQSGMLGAANSAKQRVLLRLGADRDLTRAQRRLEEIFPEGNLKDFSGAHRQQTATTESGIAFLSVTAFLAFALGSIGLAIAIRRHADDALPSLAILRILGARGSQMLSVFLLQIGVMVVAALGIGIALGFWLRDGVLALAGSYVVLPAAAEWNNLVVVESAVAGLLALAPALIRPALLIRHLRPAVLLRQNAMEPVSQSMPRGPVLAAFAISGCACGLLAYRMLRSWKSAFVLMAALAGCAAVAWIFTTLALRWMRGWAARRTAQRRPLFRYGIANLFRPGHQARALIVALATCLAVLISTFEAGSAVARAAFEVLPLDQNTLYIAGFKDLNRETVRTFVERQPGVEQVKVLTQARLELRIIRAAGLPATAAPDAQEAGAQRPTGPPGHTVPIHPDGTCAQGFVLDSFAGADFCASAADAGRVPVDEPRTRSQLRREILVAAEGATLLTADEWNFYFSRVIGVEQTATLFPGSARYQKMTVNYYLGQRVRLGLDSSSQLVTCVPAAASDGTGAAKLSMAEDLARQLHVQVGSRLAFDARDRGIEATVAEIRKPTPEDRFWSAIELDCSGLNPASLFRDAAVRVHPSRIAAVLQAIRAEYPTLAVISPRDISETVTAVSRDAGTLVRLVAWFAVAAGLCVLVAVVAASRASRLTEIGIFSALGARRKTMLMIYTVEFAAIGVLSGLLGAILASGFVSAVLSVVFQKAEALLNWTTVVAAISLAAACTVAAGWLPTFGLMRRKPMDILRGE